MNFFWITIVIAGIVLSSFSEPLEFWNFNDARGTEMDDLLNDGSIGSVWNFGDDAMTVDGEGHFVLLGNGGSKTRKLPASGSENSMAHIDCYTSLLPRNETYIFEMTFSSWDMTAASDRDQVSFKVVNSDGIILGLILFKKKEEGVLIKLSLGDKNFRSFEYELKESRPIKVSIKFNLQDDTAEYFINDISQDLFHKLNLSGEIAGLIFSKLGNWNSAASSIHIDSMGLSIEKTDPELKTLDLLVARDPASILPLS